MRMNLHSWRGAPGRRAPLTGPVVSFSGSGRTLRRVYRAGRRRSGRSVSRIPVREPSSPMLSQVGGTVRRVDGEAEVPRVSPALLRRAEVMCRRRLAREYAGGKRNANRGADARFAVSNRISEDARLAQAEL